MYNLSEAGNPPQQRFIDPIKDRYPTLPFYDERAFEDMANLMGAANGISGRAVLRIFAERAPSGLFELGVAEHERNHSPLRHRPSHPAHDIVVASSRD